MKIVVAYDGTELVGWQRQPQGTSVQGLLEDVLAKLEGTPVAVHGAGRTDAGVHAIAQVASASVTCSHDGPTLVRALNAQLPSAVRVLEIHDAPPGFHARFSARAKTYRYLLATGPVADPFTRRYLWHAGGRLDLDAMRAAAAAFVGTHDYAAFQSAGGAAGGTIRTVFRSDLFERGADESLPGAVRGPVLVYEITGTGFLRHMVRAIVGTLVDVGRGRWTPAHAAALLRGGARAEAGATAPAQGLFLVRVDYH